MVQSKIKLCEEPADRHPLRRMRENISGCALCILSRGPFRIDLVFTIENQRWLDEALWLCLITVQLREQNLGRLASHFHFVELDT